MFLVMSFMAKIKVNLLLVPDKTDMTFKHFSLGISCGSLNYICEWKN